MAKTKQRQARARSSRRANGTIPSALSKQDRVQAIASALVDIQRQELELGLLQTASGHDDADPIAATPGQPRLVTDAGEPATYKDRRKVLKDSQHRLVAQHRDLMPQVRAYIAGLHAQQG